MPDNSDREILIPEVLPPDHGDARREPSWQRATPPPREQPPRRSMLDQIANFAGPVLSGLILDFSHRYPMRLPGFFLGLFLGYWFARVCELRAGQRFLIALAAAFIGVYGLRGHFLPIATLAGLFFAMKNQNRYRERHR